MRKSHECHSALQAKNVALPLSITKARSCGYRFRMTLLVENFLFVLSLALSNAEGPKHSEVFCNLSKESCR